MAMSRSLAGTRFITRSSIRSSPAVIASSPAIMRSVVDLPQPDGPSRTMNSPSSIAQRDVVDRGRAGALEALADAIEADHRHRYGPLT